MLKILLENEKKNKVPTRVRFSSVKAPNKIQRKFLFVVGVKNQSSKLNIVLIKQKICKSWDLNLYLALQNPVVQWVPSEFLTIVREVTEVYCTTTIQTRTYSLKLFCPNIPAETIYSELKIVGKTTLNKKENDPTERIIFLKYLNICEEKN